MATPPPMENSPVISATPDLERRVMATLMASETRGDPPWLCAVQVAQCCDTGESDNLGNKPNAEVASILVSNLCFSHNRPFMWKLLEQAMATKLVYPLHVLALLTPRVIPNRREQPEAYRLYLELMRRYAISFSLLEAGSCKEKITKSIDDALQLSDTYQVERMDLGMAVVLFIVSAITSLLDGVLLDFQLVNEGSQSMDVDVKSRFSNNKSKQLRQTNAFTALEVLESMCSSKIIQVSLRLVHLNMSEPFKGLLQRLQLLEAQNLSSNSLPPINHLLKSLFSHVKKASISDYGLKRRNLLGHVLDTGLGDSPLSHLISAGKARCWIPFDLLMENFVDRKTFCPPSAFEILTGLTRTLQIVNQASWEETFQALWISALRLVQRARDPVVGPISYIESRLSILLSIVPLSIVPLLKEDNDAIISVRIIVSSRKQSLVACLQSLAQFSSLLNPPQPVVSAANDAATKAAIVARDFNMASSNLMMPCMYSTKAVGNLLHLVVESCIARDLIDTSAYFWPGYVVPCGITEDPNSTLIQDCPWSNFMQGALLTESLQRELIAIPAPSVTELKKLNHLALHGTEEERAAAPKILCGASLTLGWNIQEHAIHMAVRLLSPEMSLGSAITRDASSYLSHMHMLAALQSCLSQYSIIDILSLYGVVPDIVAALMPLCEAFGSFPPPSTNQSSTVEEVTPYSVFSFAFLFLLRLSKFYAPDKGLYSSNFGGPVRPDLKLDFLLQMRNRRVHNNSIARNRYYVNKIADPFHDLRCHSMYVHSFPKLHAWYVENQTRLASDLSDKCNHCRMHQVANKILILICRNVNKDKWSVSSSASTITSTGSGSTTFSSSTSGSSYGGSFGSMSEDEYQGQLHYPAWELLEAVPLVLDAIVTACSYGKISSRDLTTGLRDLVDFFPASVAAIIGYFKAEITHGAWKSVPLNGIDWPSPGETLNSFRLEVKEVLEHVGLHIKNLYQQDMQPVLPLPVAAFLSLGITFKLEKHLEYTRAVIGQGIQNYAVFCPGSIVLTIGALWAQKARSWYDFVVFSGCPYFTNDKDVVDQLLSSCFKAFLGPTSVNSNSLTSTSGVVGLLGESVCNNHAMRPGILFLHTCHAFHAPHYFSEVICKLVVEWACKLADEWTLGGPAQLKFGRMSLAKTICIVRQVAILGASLLCIAGRSPLVQVLFEQTVPTFLLSKLEERSKQTCISSILEGYAISYLLFFSASLAWGVRAETAPDKYRSSDMSPFAIANHLGFIARVTEGNIVLRCDPGMWKAHVSSFVGLIVRFAPAWVPSTKLDALKKISSSLRGWHEYDLALSLLELGGISAIEAALGSVS